MKLFIKFFIVVIGACISSLGCGGGGSGDSIVDGIELSNLYPSVDIVLVIDNSGGMGSEISEVQNSINSNLVQPLDSSGIDYRIILLSRHGNVSGPESICIEAPLSGIPAGGCSPAPPEPINNPPGFFHYSVEISSLNSLCKILETFNIADEFDLAPNGWSQWLREGSYVAFVIITDDDVSCTYNMQTFVDSNTVAGGNAVASDFDIALFELSPNHFGNTDNRNYGLYSIIGMQANTPTISPWLPSDPININLCSPGSGGPGTGYQGLSKLTGGWRFPICQISDFDLWFSDVGDSVGGRIECQFDMVDVAKDVSEIYLEFNPGDNQIQQWDNVVDESACAGLEFYYDDNTDPQKVILCPDACEEVKDNTGSTVTLK